jgi:citrate synthase
MDSGLAGLVAAETVLSHSDGARGILWVRGHILADLAANFGYDGAVGLLWEGFAGTGLDRETMRRQLAAGRERAFARLANWLDWAEKRPLVEGVRLALAALPEDSAPADVLATLPVAIAALLRRRAGVPPVAPDPARGTAGDLLRMAYGAPAEPPGTAATAAALDTYFCVVIDNGLNTSAFTARVIASSRASLVSAALGAYCAFTGPLHGGAPGPTLDLLDEAAASGDVTAGAARKLAAGERLMGFGHRVFRLGDPRAALLRPALERLGGALGRGYRPARFRGRGRSRRRGGVRPAETGLAAAAAECRDQRRPAARRGRAAARRFHAGLRGGARRRVAGACDGAAERRAADPPVLGLYRAAPGRCGSLSSAPVISR